MINISKHSLKISPQFNFSSGFHIDSVVVVVVVVWCVCVCVGGGGGGGGGGGYKIEAV